MKTLLLTLVSTTLLFVTSAGHASAEDWTHTTSLKYAKQTNIRVVEPAGYSVNVNGQNDTIPAIFNLTNEDAYHKVTITAPDGTVWKEKIEVSANKQTVLRVTHTPAAVTDKAKVRKYIGRATNTCKNKRGASFRFDFLLDGDLQKSTVLGPNKYDEITVNQGDYDIRVFSATTKAPVFTHYKTYKLKIESDGWRFAIPSC